MGLSICKAFIDDGFDVRVFDLDKPINRKRLRTLGASVDIVWGDITQLESVRPAMDGVDAVVHLAGILPPLSEKNPELADRVNVGGTQNIIELVKEKQELVPFVFTSSAAVFGPTPDATELLYPERNQPNPCTTYARTKVQAEEIIKDSGIPYLILRLAMTPHLRTTFGPSDIRRNFFSIPLENRVEFVHPDDVALAILNGVKKFDKVKGNTLIIAGGRNQQIVYEDMIRALLKPFGLPIPPRHKFTREPYDLDWYDTSKSQELLQFQHRTLADFSRDISKQIPAPLSIFMRYFFGPVCGRVIVRLL